MARLRPTNRQPIRKLHRSPFRSPESAVDSVRPPMPAGVLRVSLEHRELCENTRCRCQKGESR